MGRLVPRSLLAVAVLLAFLCASATAAERRKGAEYVPGELIVKFKDGVSKGSMRQARNARGLRTLREFGRPGLQKLQLRRGGSVEQAARDLVKSGLVEYAEPNYILHKLDVVPNDPRFGDQWALKNTGVPGADIQATDAWTVSTGSADMLVAVIDTGVQITHPDLAANIWTNPDEIAGNGLDDDGNGYVDDVNGWDFYGGDNSVFDSPTDDDHGTHVSGTIAAVTDNGLGVSGINWQARIIPLKFIGPPGGSTSDAIDAIEYAADKGVKVISASWGGGGYSIALKDAIEASGALFIAAAGNDYLDADAEPMYPAAYESDNIISVASSTSTDARSSFSNWGGTSVDVAAPGSNILSTVPTDSYAYFSGTSMATPHVSGLAALVLADGLLTPAEAKNLILNSVDRLEAFSGLVRSGGRINAYNAMLLPVDDLHMAASIYEPSSREGGKDSPVMVGQGAQIRVRVGHGVHLTSGATVTLTNSIGGDPIVLTEDSPGLYSGVWTPTNTETAIVTLTAEAVKDGLTTGSDVVTVTSISPTYHERTVRKSFVFLGDPQGWRADDDLYDLALPFPFPFFGEDRTSVKVCTNGYLEFGDDTYPQWWNSDEDLRNSLRIAPLWNDLRTDQSGQTGEDIYIRYPSSDSIGIRWRAELYGSGVLVNVEVILHRSGRIEFLYGPSNNPVTPTVGVSDGSGSDYLLSQYNSLTDLDNQDALLIESVVAGDLSEDGIVDFHDLPLFTGAYGSSLGDPWYRESADLNADGFVDFSDLPIFRGIVQK